MKTLKLTLLTLVAVAASASLAHAASITYSTASGATESGGNPVNASATFTTGANTLTITLSNLLANPTSVAQNISDLFFTLSTGQTSGTIASSGGALINIDGSGNATSAGTSSNLGWSLTYSAATGFHLDDLNGATNTPAYTIIGPGPYTNANGSIAGNGPHNPFVNQTGNFTLTISGITAATTVTSATFSFGTASGNNVPGRPSVPDSGATLALLGSALTGLEVLRRKFAKRS